MQNNSDKQNAREISIVDDLLALREIEKTLLTKAIKDLVFMARTSAAVSYDKGLIESCDMADDLLLRLFGEKPKYFIGTENGIADIDTPPSDN